MRWMSGQLYGEQFFADQDPGSARSADAIVPIVVDMLQPTSVVDVGCGLGSWLAVFEQHGVERILGIDGDWVDVASLKIPAERYLARDLTKPLRVDKQFDLVLSLEVGEHLPPESAEIFVESLTTLGPVIVFSAALPGQGGTGHLNEQWPEYWVQLFAARGYTAIDCIRDRIWNDERVDFCYAQNTLLFAHEVPAALTAAGRLGPLSIVHPRLLESVTRTPPPPPLRQLLKPPPAAIRDAVVRRVRRLRA
jgi:SAM-dependent methyltransferase